MISIKDYKVCITNVDFMLMRIFFSFSHVVSHRGELGIGVSFCHGYKSRMGNLGVLEESISEQFLLGSKPII